VQAKKYREIEKEHADDPDEPLIAVFISDGKHAE
jgi:hypothetical protein